MTQAAAGDWGGRGRQSSAPASVSSAATVSLAEIHAAARRRLTAWSALASMICHVGLGLAFLPAIRDLDAPQMPAGGPAIEIDLAAADAVDSTQSIAAPKFDAPVADTTPAAPEPTPAESAAADA
ncbi:MAG: hypothetical protein QM651_09005, partial [Rhodoblastus sp.]